MKDFATVLDALLGGQDMSERQARTIMDQTLEGDLGPERLAAFITALRAKGPHADELVGFARSMREHAAPLATDGDVLDNCGTGGAPRKAFNISTAAAFVVAADGVPVAKHGNRSVTRPSGSADVLERAGARLDLSPEQCGQVLDETGIAFLFAPAFHPAMRHAGPVRQALGIKTVFNLLGPLTNPAAAKLQVLGVYDAALVPLMAQALAELGCRSGYVVHGEPGYDEATPCGPVHCVRIQDGRAGSVTAMDPADAGLNPADGKDLAAVSGEKAPCLLREVLSGKASGPRLDAVAFNAGLALHAAGRSPDVAAGVGRARDIMDDGIGTEKLEAFIAATQRAR